MMKRPSHAHPPIRHVTCRAQTDFGSTPFFMKKTLQIDVTRPAKSPNGTPKTTQLTDEVLQTQQKSNQHLRPVHVLSP